MNYKTDSGHKFKTFNEALDYFNEHDCHRIYKWSAAKKVWQVCHEI